jgi:hypothetical protein
MISFLLIPGCYFLHILEFLFPTFLDVKAMEMVE